MSKKVEPIMDDPVLYYCRLTGRNSTFKRVGCYVQTFVWEDLIPPSPYDTELILPEGLKQDKQMQYHMQVKDTPYGRGVLFLIPVEQWSERITTTW